MAVIKPRLSELPEELISNISIKLGSDDVFAFRLTCKALQQRSFHEFANEYFSQKCFMLTTESLKVLTRIAESEKLRDYLHHIFIVPALFSERVFKCCHGSGCAWKPTVRHTEAMRGYIEDQKGLKEGSRDLEMLTQAFKKLPALHAITFADSYSSLPRSIDLRGAASSSRKTNNSPTTLPQHPGDKEYYRYKNHVWKTLIRAIANSGTTTLQRLYTDLHNAKNPLELINLNLDVKTLDSLGKALHGLKTLCLQISSVDSKKSDEVSDGIDTVKGAQIMERFARIMPSVEKLALAFSYSPSSSILCQNFTANIDLSKIRNLKLDSLYIDVKSLTITLLQAENLEDLQLVWIDLTEGTWPTILNTLLTLKKLNHLHLMYLYEAGRQVRFLKPSKGGSTGSGGNSFADFLNGYGVDDDDDDDDDYDPDEHEDSDSEGEDDEDSNDDSLPALLDSNETTTSRPDEDSIQGESDSEYISDSDADMPPLEPQDVVPPPPPQATSTLGHNHQNSHGAPSHPTDGPTFGTGLEHGRYICLSTSKLIHQHLPTFIKEYNLGESDDGDDDFMNALAGGAPGPAAAGGVGAGGAGAGGPGGNMNNFLNTLGAAFGMGPPTNVVGNAQGGAATFVGPALPPPPPGAAGGVGGPGGVAVGLGGGGAGGGPLLTLAAYGPYPMAPPPPPPPANANANGQAGMGAGADGSEDEDDNGRWSDNEF